MRVPHHVGRLVADKIVEGLAPHCERIEIAGSLRRLRPTIGDIDLVAIPRFASKSSLFGPVPLAETDFMAALLDFAEDDDGISRANCMGDKIVRFKTRWEKSGSAGEIQVDCYLATPESWATLLLIRTGSAEHNIWLAQRAKACGGKLHADGSGLEVPGQYDPLAQRVVNSRVIRAQTEEEIFKALGLPLPLPADRECKNGRPVWLPGGVA
ncbi:MAG: hypothetical protein LAN84_09715 [Acidobacteriia bacterium]|nr:hypothetical protein [Terriglobia bacterium]